MLYKYCNVLGQPRLQYNGTSLQYSCLENPRDGGDWWAAVHGVAESTRLSNFTFTFHFRALEKEMAAHSSILAWRIPWTGQPGGLQSMGSHWVRQDWATNTFTFHSDESGGRCLSSLESHPLPPTLNTFPFKIGTDQVNFSLNFMEHFYILIFRSLEIWPS